MRPITYPVSHVGHGKNVTGHARRSACVASSEPAHLGRGPSDEDARGAEESEDASVSGPKELDVDVRALLERHQADPARLDSEVLKYLHGPHHIKR